MAYIFLGKQPHAPEIWGNSVPLNVTESVYSDVLMENGVVRHAFTLTQKRQFVSNMKS